MSEQMLKACKELIDDAGLVCANLVFKETCLEILSKARIVLSDKQFKQLVLYVTEKMREKIAVEVQPTQPELTIQEQTVKNRQIPRNAMLCGARR